MTSPTARHRAPPTQARRTHALPPRAAATLLAFLAVAAALACAVVGAVALLGPAPASDTRAGPAGPALPPNRASPSGDAGGASRDVTQRHDTQRHDTQRDFTQRGVTQRHVDPRDVDPRDVDPGGDALPVGGLPLGASPLAASPFPPSPIGAVPMGEVPIGDVPIGGPLEFPVAGRDLGRLDAGVPTRVEFPWRCRGPGLVRVLALETGCSCVVVSGLPESIPPGAEGTLVLDVRGRTRPGPFTVVVRILTDRPPDDLLRLTLRAFVGSAVVVDPVALDLGRVPAGHEATRILTVRPPPEVGEVRVEARLADLAGRCEVLPPARRGVLGADVRVHARVPERLGPFQGLVEVRVPREGVWRVIVRGEAVPAASAATPVPAPVPREGVPPPWILREGGPREGPASAGAAASAAQGPAR